jgi:3,4-dihydroxy-2-butanone 4-phosphate synthase
LVSLLQGAFHAIRDGLPCIVAGHDNRDNGGWLMASAAHRYPYLSIIACN